MGKKRGDGHVRRDTGRRGRPAGLPGGVDAQGVTGDGRAGIVWHSNFAAAGTGYGVQTAQVVRQIKATGRPVTLSNNYGTQGFITAWEGVEVLPTGFHPYSADVLTAHHKYAQETQGRPVALVTLFDCWVYKNSNVDDIDVIASWVPIDHMPVPVDVIDWCSRPNVLPVTMAKFGTQMLERAGIASMYAPHAVDTDVFRPDATIDGATGRELLNIPADAFVVGMVAANKGVAPLRKAWGENLLALGQFMADHDDVWLYLHTEKRGAQGGVDLVKLAEACGIPADRTVWTDQWAYYAGLDPAIVAVLMGALDVHLLCSRGEGFGVPVIETAACGVPSIVSNFTAQPELVGDHGWLASVQPYWDAGQGAWFATPLVGSIVDQLDDAYVHARDEQRRQAARTFALDYDHRVVFDRHWQPILAEIDRRVAALENP